MPRLIEWGKALFGVHYGYVAQGKPCYRVEKVGDKAWVAYASDKPNQIDWFKLGEMSNMPAAKRLCLQYHKEKNGGL